MSRPSAHDYIHGVSIRLLMTVDFFHSQASTVTPMQTGGFVPFKLVSSSERDTRYEIRDKPLACFTINEAAIL